MNRLPVHGEWLIVNPARGARAPFSQMEIWFDERFGFARQGRQATVLASLLALGGSRFGAAYRMGRQRGFFDARVGRDDTLEIRFLGTVATHCTAWPLRVDARRPWSLRRLALLAPALTPAQPALIVNEQPYQIEAGPAGRGWRAVPVHPMRLRSALSFQPVVLEEVDCRASEAAALVETLLGHPGSGPVLAPPSGILDSWRRRGLVTGSYLLCEPGRRPAAAPAGVAGTRTWESAFSW